MMCMSESMIFMPFLAIWLPPWSSMPRLVRLVAVWDGQVGAGEPESTVRRSRFPPDVQAGMIPLAWLRSKRVEESLRWKVLPHSAGQDGARQNRTP